MRCGRQRAQNRPCAPRRAGARGAGWSEEAWFRGVSLDWSRLHLQMLFVDCCANGLPSRLAEALMRRVADWNGAAWLLFTDSAGLDAVRDAPAGSSVSSVPALCSVGHRFGLDSRYFTRGSNRFSDPLDFHLHDLILSCSSEDSAHADLKALAFESSDKAEGAVLPLSHFAHYLSDADLLETEKGSAPLPEDLARWLGSEDRLPRARDAGFELPAVTAETLASDEGQRKCNLWMASAVVSIAGMTRFLLDTCPVEMLERKYFPD